MITKQSKVNIYCDGGLIRQQPSMYGGVYAYIIQQPDFGEDCLSHGVGWIWSRDATTLDNRSIPTISNNYIEAWAIATAIRQFWKERDSLKFTDAEVNIISDSRNGLQWAASPEKPPPTVNGIPYGDRYNYPKLMESIGLVEAIIGRKHSGYKWNKILCKGHPTAKELAQGYSDRASHRPVFQLQNKCHKLCEILSDILGECCDYGSYDDIDAISSSVNSEVWDRYRKYEERSNRAGSRQGANVGGGKQDTGKAVHALLSLRSAP